MSVPDGLSEKEYTTGIGVEPSPDVGYLRVEADFRE